MSAGLPKEALDEAHTDKDNLCLGYTEYTQRSTTLQIRSRLLSCPIPLPSCPRDSTGDEHRCVHIIVGRSEGIRLNIQNWHSMDETRTTNPHISGSIRSVVKETEKRDDTINRRWKPSTAIQSSERCQPRSRTEPNNMASIFDILVISTITCQRIKENKKLLPGLHGRPHHTISKNYCRRRQTSSQPCA